MLNMNELNGAKVNDNVVIINECRFLVSDDVALKIYQMCSGKKMSVSEKKADVEFVKLDTGSNMERIGKFVTVYDGIKVRYWESEGFTPKNVKEAIKSSLKAAGAKWNDDDKAMVFDTKKAASAWIKAQKEYYERAKK